MRRLLSRSRLGVLLLAMAFASAATGVECLLTPKVALAKKKRRKKGKKKARTEKPRQHNPSLPEQRS